MYFYSFEHRFVNMAFDSQRCLKSPCEVFIKDVAPHSYYHTFIEKFRQRQMSSYSDLNNTLIVDS